uniref:Uncharacterized protein n=1 Tax=Anopheles farauti TaxID=69004 RepID=A0A182QKY4_9DIPT
MKFEIYQKYSHPKTIMSFVLRLLHTVGLNGRGTRQTIRLASIFVFYLTFTVVPQLAGGQTDVHQFVRASVEFLFNCNIFVGSLCFAYGAASFRSFIREIRILAEFVSALSYKLKHTLTRFNRRVDLYAKAQTACMAAIGLIYWIAPLPSVVYSGYSNTTEAPRFVQHLEVKFYWLENRTSLRDYMIFVVIMLPVICMCSAMCNLKVLTISTSIEYCTLFTKLVIRAAEDLHDPPATRRTSQDLSNVVLMHVSLLKCIKLLDSALQPVLLLQWIVCGLNWSISLVYLTNTGVTLKSVTVIVMFMLATFETLLYCFLGTRLAVQQERLERAFYNTPWYEYPLELQNNLRIVMKQSQRHAHITVAKFFHVNLEEFGRIVHLSYSVYVVLKDEIKMR